QRVRGQLLEGQQNRFAAWGCQRVSGQGVRLPRRPSPSIPSSWCQLLDFLLRCSPSRCREPNSAATPQTPLLGSWRPPLTLPVQRGSSLQESAGAGASPSAAGGLSLA